MTENYSNLCRTCLSQISELKTIFSTPLEQNITYRDMIMSLTSVLIIENDGLPVSICMYCTVELQRAFKFKKLIEQSDFALRKNVQAATENIEQETKVDYKYDENDTDTGFDISTEFAIEENDLKVKSDTESEKSKKKSYTCDQCNEECLGLASYWKHIAQIHKTLFKCSDCGKRFKTQGLLTNHRRSAHKLEKKRLGPKKKTDIKKTRNLPRTCDVCHKTFRFHSNLERHKLIHTGEKPYLCNVCGKGFGQMSYLKIHSFIHTGEKPYKCQMCERSFAAPGTLMTHVRIHTGERPHVCKICGKDFLQSGYLAAHIRTHTGEKPVECKVCHRRFNQSGRLSIHMRIHSGEKPYTCKDCGRSFAVKGTLKKHIRTHTGERPYVCSVCGQAFAQSGTLSTHMKVHRDKV